MKASHSVLLPLLRSPFQGEFLAWLFLHPEAEYSLAELAQRFGVSAATVTREADRFVSSGFITERRLGNLRLIRADMETPVAPPLAELLALTYGPVAVLPELMVEVPGIDEAYIYGSWASRYRGHPGRIPNDIDVLVVGDADEDALFDLAHRAGRALGREVSIRRISRRHWDAPDDDPFLVSVRSKPLIQLK